MRAKKKDNHCRFTFHYVSIKTESSSNVVLSTVLFTFHYVSIKTILLMTEQVGLMNLHSTMYLLKRMASKYI